MEKLNPDEFRIVDDEEDRQRREDELFQRKLDEAYNSLSDEEKDRRKEGIRKLFHLATGLGKDELDVRFVECGRTTDPSGGEMADLTVETTREQEHVYVSEKYLVLPPELIVRCFEDPVEKIKSRVIMKKMMSVLWSDEHEDGKSTVPSTTEQSE